MNPIHLLIDSPIHILRHQLTGPTWHVRQGHYLEDYHQEGGHLILFPIKIIADCAGASFYCMVCRNNFIWFGLWLFLPNRGGLARLDELKQITRCFTCISVFVPTDVLRSYMKTICPNNDCVDLVSDRRSFECAPCSAPGQSTLFPAAVPTTTDVVAAVQCSAAARSVSSYGEQSCPGHPQPYSLPGTSVHCSSAAQL